MLRRKKLTINDLLFPKERVAILSVFSVDIERGLGVKEVATIANLPIEFVEYHIEFFTEAGILHEVVQDDIKTYKMRVEDEKVRAIKDFLDAWPEPTHSLEK